MDVTVKTYFFGVHSSNINEFLPYVESGYVYPTRQDYTMFVAKDQTGQVYKSKVIAGQENKVINMIYKYKVTSVNLTQERVQNNSLLETVISNTFQKEYTCKTVGANNLYSNSTCEVTGVIEVPPNPNLPKNPDQVPTMAEWSLILTALLVVAVFWSKVKAYAQI